MNKKKRKRNEEMNKECLSKPLLDIVVLTRPAHAQGIHPCVRKTRTLSNLHGKSKDVSTDEIFGMKTQNFYHSE